MPQTSQSRSATPLSIALVMTLLLALAGQQIVSAAPDIPPILLVTADPAGLSNKFSGYLREILLAEGHVAFDTKDITTVSSASVLQPYRLVVLAEMPLDSAQAGRFISYVNGGGRLIAMRPDADLTTVFGVTRPGGTDSNCYVKIQNVGPGQGLPTSQTLQTHTDCDRYQLATATEVARAYSTASSDTGRPAVVVNTYGQGEAAAFAYDLARAVVMLRQGNPANANVDSDGDGVLRTIDLFQGSGGGAPWVDLDRVPIPQADEQMRLLTNIILDLTGDALPLPRLWYFPDREDTVLVLTGDAHGNLQSQFNAEMNSINAKNGKITLYVTSSGYLATEEGVAAAATWRGQGHSIGVHPYGAPTNANLNVGYNNILDWFGNNFGVAPARSARHHQVLWEGWTDAAAVAESRGMAMDANFYHWGSWLRNGTTWAYGHITGSGLPMKFMSSSGELIDVFQQNTQLVDEHLIGSVTSGYGGTWPDLGGSQAATVSCNLIDASLAGDYAALMTQFHVDYYNFEQVTIWAEGTMDCANQKGVPIWDAERWLSFTETRYGTKFNNFVWDDHTNKLTFQLAPGSSPTPGNNVLTLMLPATTQGEAIEEVRVGGQVAATTVKTIKGRSYALVSVPAGAQSIAVTYEGGATGPSPTPTKTATAVPPTATPARDKHYYMPLTLR